MNRDSIRVRAFTRQLIPELIAQVKKIMSQALVGVICAITPRCHEMTRLISAEREEPLSWLTKLRMRWHYGICVWCVRYRDQLGLLGRLLRAFPEESCRHGKNKLTEDAKVRMKNALRRKPND